MKRSFNVFSKLQRTVCIFRSFTVATRYLWAQMVKNPSAMWETWVRSPAWEDSLKESMATYSSIVAWRIPMDRGA